jgi:transposase-like protein
MRDGDLASRLVVKRYAKGRCIYDEAAKRELFEACPAPGASVAKLAREHAVNANLLHTWLEGDFWSGTGQAGPQGLLSETPSIAALAA